MTVLSADVGGLTRAQATELLDALENYTDDLNAIEETILKINQATLQSNLPGENSFANKNTVTDTTQIFRRLNLNQMKNLEISLQVATGNGSVSHNGSVKVPAVILDNVTL